RSSVFSCRANHENSILVGGLSSRARRTDLLRAFLSPRVHSPARGHGRRTLRRPASTRSGVGTVTPGHTPASFRTMGGFACRGTVHRLPRLPLASIARSDELGSRRQRTRGSFNWG